MKLKKYSSIEILEFLSSVNSAPYYENETSNLIIKLLKETNIPFIKDDFGNIIANHKPDQINNNISPIAFIAHMDHPGFEATSYNENNELEASPLGGVPISSLISKTPILIRSTYGNWIKGKISPVDNYLNNKKVYIDLENKQTINLPAPVVFDLKKFSIKNNNICMRAIDDLAGCASILSALLQIAETKISANMIAVFTRAEEVGLIGARLMCENKTLPINTTVISVESSPLIPGVFQGEGPIIRIGDRQTTFNYEAEEILTKALKNLQSQKPNFKAQRKLMDGGTCEGTAFNLAGYKTTGIAFPLKNYHNASNGINDTKSKIVEESIFINDYLGGIELIKESVIVNYQNNDNQNSIKLEAVDQKTKEKLIHSNK